MSGDDLHEWGDHELVRALRAPGTASELAGQEQYVTAFRASRINVSPLRRGLRRLGTGGTTVVAVVALSSGVAAAAYTQHLPDPVQRVVHDVLGAPAPKASPKADPPPPTRATAVPSTPTSTATPGTTGGRETRPTPTSAPTASPTATPTSAPTPTPTATATETETPTSTPTSAPTTLPTTDAPTTPPPTTQPPTTPPPTTPPPMPEPAAVSVAGTSHRADPGTSLTLWGTVTAADGSPVAAHDVVLQRRGPQRWLRVAVATADTAGSVSFTTPPADATATYRLVGGARVRSHLWRIVLVPRITVTSTPAGPAVDVTATVTGAQPGDRLVLLRRATDRLVTVGRTSVGPDGAAAWRVVPARPTTYVVRLPATAAHARAVARLTVTPPRPDAVDISAESHQTGPGGSVTIRGVVRAAGGAPLPGEAVVLQVRDPDGWQPVGTATSDAYGTVAVTTPPAGQTAVYRLRAGPATSGRWRVVLVPALTATVTPGQTGDQPSGIAVTALGGQTSDTVVLLRWVDGGLVAVLQTELDAAGAAQFQVTPDRRTTHYVIRLPATSAHGAARVPVDVPPSPG